MIKTKKAFWLILGFLCLGLGTLGIVLPCFPTVPFYMGTGFCFAKSSKKLHNWFLGTKIYKNHLESFAKKREMTMKTKCSLAFGVSALMVAGFFMMQKVPAGQMVLALIWVIHMYYFFIRVKTSKPGTGAEAAEI